MPPVALKRPDGAVVWLPEQDVPHAEARGFARVSTPELSSAITAPEDTQGGIGGMARAGLSSLLSGATVGLSDVAAKGLLSHGDVADIQQAREDHPTISTAANIAGAVAPALLTDGESLGARSLLEATPAAKIGRIGSAIAESGADMGALSKAAASATGAATEGALYGAGGYVSDVALGDRKLSADGFVGAMGDGALWGGVAGGALSLSSAGLQAARKLLPAADLTPQGALAVRRAATSEVSSALADSTELAQTAQSRLSQIADQEAAVNPSLKQQLDAIRLQNAQEIADERLAQARAKTTVAEVRAKDVASRAESRAAREAEAARTQRSKPALDFLKQFEQPVNNEVSTLESQLGGTKRAVDEGSTLSQINEAVAKANPEAAKINGALVKAKASSEELQSWLGKYGPDSAVAFDSASAAGKRQKIADWAKGFEPLDEKGEVVQQHFLGDPENMGVRADGSADPAATKAANTAAADSAHRAYLEAVPKAVNESRSGTEVMARSRYEAMRAAAKTQDDVYSAFRAGNAPTGDEIVAASQPPTAKIDKALKAQSADFADDISKTAPMITRHEAAHADLADALGANAPQSAQARTSAFRDAQAHAQDKINAQAAMAGDKLAKAPSTSLGRQLLDKAANTAQMYQALQMMGVPLPNPSSIPVVGPLLSAYLKAKLVSKISGRTGGGIMSTAEGTIASKAAAVRQQVFRAVDAGLSGASKATAALAKVAGGPADILGHKLFAPADSKVPDAQPAYTSAPEKGSIGALYLARAAEVNASQQPDAIANAIKARVNVSDPEILQETIETAMRKLNYLAAQMPRPSTPPGPLESRVWLPAKQDLAAWTQCISAVEDPAGALQRAVAGRASAKEIEAVKTVYPALYAEGQQRFLQGVAEGKGRDLSIAQRQQLSRVWGVPMDSGSTPAAAAWKGEIHAAAPPPPQPSGIQGQPTLAGPMMLGQRTMTRLDGG